VAPRSRADHGPLSTPAIADGRVFAISSSGRLLALSLIAGEVLWSKELTIEFGALEPYFGFTTSPLVVDGVLVVLTGGPEGKAISGLVPASGEAIWSHGKGKVEYQNPVALTLGGELQVVAVSGKRIEGLRGADGELLWRHELGEDDGVASAIPTFAGTDRFLITVSGDARVFSASRQEGKLAVEELYRTKALGGGYALPVFHQGYLYGYRGKILTCVNAADGERVWRSRPPGGQGLLLAGDKLVVYGARGVVAIADASPEGYLEHARIEALSGSSYTWPSFAAGRVFVRNLEEMAAVVVSRGSGASGEELETPATAHQFDRFLESLQGAEDKAARVTSFLGGQTKLPLIEGDFIHFLYQGEVDDLAIYGTMIESGGTQAMERVAGTNLYYKSFRLEQGGRWDYGFVKNFGERLADPRNPRRVPNIWGRQESSEVWLPGYAQATYLEEAEEVRRGSVHDLTFNSKAGGTRKELKIYLPAGYAESAGNFPLLIVHDGFEWLDKGLMARSLDNLIGVKIEPMVVAFVKPADAWWEEAGGSATDAYADILATELVPFLESKYRLRPGASSRALVGNSGFAVTSAYTALKHPRVFGRVALLSVRLGLGSDDRLLELIGHQPRPPVTFYLDWNRYESRDVDTGLDISKASRRLADALKNQGYNLAGGEVLDSHGWAGWRARNGDLLEALFPLGEE